MSIETIREQLPDYARDLRLNLGSVLTPQGAPGLSEKMIASVALATAIAAVCRSRWRSVRKARRTTSRSAAAATRSQE